MNILLVGLGGFIGAVFRFTLGGWVQDWSKSIGFPYGTLAVNLLGCFLIGWLSQLAESRNLFSPEVRMLVFIGLLGAFTTFSTFGLETMNLLRDNRVILAISNVLVQVVFGLGMVWVGRLIAKLIWR